MQGNRWGFDIPKQIWHRLQGRTAMVLPAGCPHSVGVKSRELSKSPLFPGAARGGGGAVVTNE